MILQLLYVGYRTNIAVNMTKVVIKILAGSAVTKTVQGGLVILWLTANYLQYNKSAKNYKNRLTCVKFTGEYKERFFGDTVYIIMLALFPKVLKL